MNTKIDTVILQSQLMRREGLSLRYAALIVTTVAHEFSDELLHGVSEWMNETLTPDFEINGCTIQDMIDETDASMFEALLLLHLQNAYPERIENTDLMWVEKGDELLGIGNEE